MIGLRRRRVPEVQQLEMADCGPACLTMVLGFHGRHVSLDAVRTRFGTGRDGVSAFDIVETARNYGLQGRAVRLDLEDFDALPPGSILHWNMAHFVVLERAHRDGVDIVDPATGRRFVRTDELSTAFTGVAIVFEPDETFRAEGSAGASLGAYARRILRHKSLLGRTLLTSILLQGLALALPIGMALVVDEIVPRDDRALLGVLAGGVVAIALYTFLAQFARAHLLLTLRTRLDLEMTSGFLRHLLRLPFAFFQTRQTGDLVMRLNSNATIRELLTAGVLSGVLDGMLVVGYLIVILWTDLRLGGVVISLGALRVLVYLATRRQVRHLTAESLQATAEASNYQVQMIEGIETLKTAGAEARAEEIWSNLYVDVLNVAIRRGRLAAWTDALLNTLELASPLVVLALGGALVLQGELTLGTMLALVALASAFLTPLGSMVSTLLQMQQLWSTIDRVEDVLRQSPEQDGARPPAPALGGGIEVRGVSFRYPGREEWAVHDVDLVVPAGAQVAIVGPSGSGKSTLARLVAGLYAPDEGEILFDGASLDDVDRASLRRQLGFVPQTPFLFGSTVRANVALVESDTPLAAIEDAARRASIADEVDTWPLRYQTPLASGGANLSGGQRQRIALARALLHRPPILILDEATSHLDTRSERRVYENLRDETSTRVVIAHRLSTIVDSDLIVVMDAGRVVERGTHDELLRRGGLYAELTAADRNASGSRDRAAEDHPSAEGDRRDR